MLTFLIMTGPYTYENSETFVNLARSALNKGYKVSAFLYVDGVYNAHLGQDPEPDTPMNQRFQELADAGVVFHACGLCTTARGFDQQGKDFITGVSVSGLTEFAELIGESDRVVTLGP